MNDEPDPPRKASAADAGAAARQGSGSARAVAPARRVMMDDALKQHIGRRLSKAAGQVLGISRMVDQDRYCADVLDQIAAVQKALDGVAQKVMRNYLERCVTDAITSGDSLIYDELMGVIFRHR
jgi:CsoR family transcriptional regulator, copper-sensing transcriptional repressor